MCGVCVWRGGIIKPVLDTVDLRRPKAFQVVMRKKVGNHVSEGGRTVCRRHESALIMSTDFHITQRMSYVTLASYLASLNLSFIFFKMGQSSHLPQVRVP